MFDGGVNGHHGLDGMADNMGNGDDHGHVRDQLGSGNASGRPNGQHGVGAWPRRHTCGPTVGDGLRRYTCSPNDGDRPRSHTFGQADGDNSSSSRRRQVMFNPADPGAYDESFNAGHSVDNSEEQSDNMAIAGDPLSSQRPFHRPRRAVQRPRHFKDFLL